MRTNYNLHYLEHFTFFGTLKKEKLVTLKMLTNMGRTMMKMLPIYMYGGSRSLDDIGLWVVEA